MNSLKILVIVAVGFLVLYLLSVVVPTTPTTWADVERSEAIWPGMAFVVLLALTFIVLRERK